MLSFVCLTNRASVDVDLPMIVDDDLWDLSRPEANYPLLQPQPDGTPCELAYFVHSIKLSQILSFVLRSLVCARLYDQTVAILTCYAVLDQLIQARDWLKAHSRNGFGTQRMAC